MIHWPDFSRERDPKKHVCMLIDLVPFIGAWDCGGLVDSSGCADWL